MLFRRPFCHRISNPFTPKSASISGRKILALWLVAATTASFSMSHVTYKIVEHDGGWAYTVNGVFSESYPTHAMALAAAKRAATEQRVPGRTEAIMYESADGRWHTETASGSDRPETDVEDAP
jgi:hypothetical protein